MFDGFLPVYVLPAGILLFVSDNLLNSSFFYFIAPFTLFRLNLLYAAICHSWSRAAQST